MVKTFEIYCSNCNSQITERGLGFKVTDLDGVKYFCSRSCMESYKAQKGIK